MMIEPLSEDAKSVLAFIRTHPGVQDYQIAWHFRMDGERLTKAIVELQDRVLIDAKLDTDDKFSNEGVTTLIRFFPRI